MPPMKPVYSARYLDGLFSSDSYGDLATLSTILCAMDCFSWDKSDYGLPRPLFVFVECLGWVAQSWRSGAWTYFETIPPDRAEAMRRGLEALSAPELALRYADGAENWRNPQAMRQLDAWMKQNDASVHGWLRSLIRAHRATFEELLK